MKRYYFKYRVYWLTYTQVYVCTAESELEATKQFIKDNPLFDIPEYRIAYTEDLETGDINFIY